MPDEARPIIVMVSKAGETVKAHKWANDQDPDFHPLYNYLLTLCRPDGELVREGALTALGGPKGSSSRGAGV